jgi:RNA polymerase sigma-70 factor (ECF subfamily)
MDFRAELERQIPYLRRFARALTGDRSAADDLVQDCIERALVKQHLYDETRPLRTWLYTMVRNLFVSSMRRNSRRGEVPADEESEGARAVAPAQERRLMLADIARALDRLPAGQRETLILVAVENLSYREVAEVTGVPLGTVMSRLSRARATLRELVLDDGDARLRRVK